MKRTPGLTLPISLHSCLIPIKKKRPLRTVNVQWPLVRMDSWLSYFMEHKPQMILGGCDNLEDGSFERLFEDFWKDYAVLDPNHKLFSSNIPRTHAIPYMLHGDEGRGANKVPFLVISWQPLISFVGPDRCNDCTPLGPKLPHTWFLVT